MPATYIPITSGTINTAVASYVISSIPTTYSALKLFLTTRTTDTSGNSTVRVRINSLTNTNYYYSYIAANTTSRLIEFTNSTWWNFYQCCGNATNNAFGNLEITFTNPSNISLGSVSGIYQGGLAWRGNSDSYFSYGLINQDSLISGSITSITVEGNGFNIAANSTYQLYGLA